MAQKLRRVGNSLGVILPARELKAAGFEEGAKLNVLPGGPGELRLVRVEDPARDLTRAQVEAGMRFVERFRKDFEILADS